MKTFEAAFEHGKTVLKNILESISENRRKFVRVRAANALMFRAATSMLWYLRAPNRFESALNEAIELRDTALELYGDDDERLKVDIEGIINNLSPEDPTSVHRVAKGKKGKQDADDKAIAAALAKHSDKIDAQQAQERDFLDTHLPTVQGFLEGARYESFDLQGSEIAQDRAQRAVLAAAEAIRDRIERDVILCGANLKDAQAKYLDSNTHANKQSRAHWFTEFTLAQSDLEAAECAIKNEGLRAE